MLTRILSKNSLAIEMQASKIIKKEHNKEQIEFLISTSLNSAQVRSAHSQ